MNDFDKEERNLHFNMLHCIIAFELLIELGNFFKGVTVLSVYVCRIYSKVLRV